MAPEQARGRPEAVGPAADVYALGAILYELLTGRPPFKAATALDTALQVLHDEPVPPRRLNPKAPADLETVCLRCLRKEPARRYTSAAALADDLGRFLDGRPIRARPAGLPERLAKWARRRPALAALLAVSVLALAGLAAGGVAYERRLRRALADTAAERRRADANYREARAALNRVLERAWDQNWADSPEVQDLRRRLHEEALGFFLKVAEGQGASPEVRADVAQAWMDAGRLQVWLGRPGAAEENFDRALGLWAALAEEFPHERRYRAGRAMCLSRLAHSQPAGEGRVRCLRTALALREALVREDPTSAEHRSALADAHDELAHNLLNLRGGPSKVRKGDETERHFLASEALRAALAREEPDVRRHRGALARTQLNLSLICQNTRRGEEMQRYHDRAAATLEGLLRDDPHDQGSLMALAGLRVNWAYVQRDRGQVDAALADLAQSVPPLEEIRRREPRNTEVRDMLFRTYGLRHELLDRQQRYAEALTACRRTVELAPSDAVREFRRLFLALACARAGDHAEAVREAEALAARRADVERHVQLLHLARVCSVAAGAAGKDLRLADAERGRRAEQHAGRALQFLKGGLAAAGPARWAEVVRDLLTEKDFQPLLHSEAWQRLLKP
jgi:tetratricopeptide (TPR) repeat protein